MFAVAMLEADHATLGTEVTVIWGEEGRGSSKPTVERHTQTQIRAIVAPAPLSDVAREAYRPT
jgi:syringate O-demethylase